ncbi:MAG: UDP-N-acetylmuramoyl-L-alanyl-D-glutamate--2,6-diaminopimelate ligase [Desulfocapsa sp.]|nr:UDP-N-acetylmuramoyl-L-alanyl-D-glutamate--2,6-diaminopimelate ligase [Desulfocapsa sp.]
MSGKWVCTAPGTVVSPSSGVSLAALTENIPVSCLSGTPATCLITRVSVDSRNVTSGSLFVALAGSENDGHDFIDQAVKRGCSAVLAEKGRLLSDACLGSGICILEVNSTRKAYGLLAETIFASPAQGMTMLAVTGTNGKTTVSYLLESVLIQAGKQPGVLGTISYRYQTSKRERREIPSPFTTPEPLLLQETLREMADNGVDHVIMEVSSHGLEQNRIGSLSFDVAAFTNLSRDHLDYHLDMDSYFAAKAILFTDHLAANGKAVISFPEEGSVWSKKLLQFCLAQDFPVLSCGKSRDYSIHPLQVEGRVTGTIIKLQTPKGACEFSSPLVGEFNVANIQTTVAMAVASGVSLSDISTALSRATGAPGRMQRIKVCPQEQSFRPIVFVDYAHTPDALEEVLKTLAQLPHASLYCVFGCGGDRDRGKRPLMGKAAGTYSDVVLVTDDNPRSEDSKTIIAAIVEGIAETPLAEKNEPWLKSRKSGEKGFVRIGDRGRAIAAAIGAAAAEDIVLIAGKGHEDYQLGSKGRRFFDDSLEAAESLSSWNLASLALATGGQIRNKNPFESGKPFGKISTDSRSVVRGDIFVALKGERFDAHEYVAQVVEAGAACLVLEREPNEPSTVPIIHVKNTEQALGDLACHRRSCMKEISQPVVVAITGSSGKTTVKEMCAAIFAEQWPEQPDKAPGRVLKTEGNFNNLIGLPLSLLPIMVKHEAVILEMGMNRPGEIRRLTEIADPDIACILNVHGAHLQGLGDIEGVAKAKGELFQTCTKETVLVVNRDDPRVVAVAGKCDQKKVFFGLGGGGPDLLDVHGSQQKVGQGEEITFTLQIKEDETRVVLQVPGLHNISNALAAAAVAHAAGIGLQVIAKGLATFLPSDRRMQILDGPSGSRVINDTYNANPASMKAGIRTLGELGTGSRIAVLGDMLELGAASEVLHKEIGALVADSGIDFLALVGSFAAFTASGAREQGMDATHVRVFAGQEECLDWLEGLVAAGKLQSDSYVLVKGSRGMHLESLVERFVKK